MVPMESREEKLKVIRVAAISANPEIGKQETNLRISRGRIQNIEGWQSRQIKIADILLVLQEKSGWYFTGVAKGMMIFESGARYYYYNLRADDLTQQSEECISFLYELLKPSV